MRNGHIYSTFRLIFRSILFFLLISCFHLTLSASEKQRLLIDTDGAFDDFRLISMLLASDQYEIAGIITCDGVLDPEQALIKVRELLCYFNAEGIPTAAGIKSIQHPCDCRQMNIDFCWNPDTLNCQPYITYQNADELLTEILADSSEKLTYICLGTLGNLASFLDKNPSAAQNIERLIWYNSTAPVNRGFNYTYDSTSALRVFSSSLNISIVSASAPARFNQSLLSCFKSPVKTSQHIYNRMSSPEAMVAIQAGHLGIWDELIAVYLNNPEYFKNEEISDNIIACRFDSSQYKRICSIFSALFQEDHSGVVYLRLPSDTSMLWSDVAMISDSLIARHGFAEFKAGVICSELHGHLGVYSLIGVKMGLRALDYFHCSMDELQVISYTGNKPPISCMNDGLQASTGATTGHGLLTVNADSPAIAAKFTFEDKSIIIRLKSDVAKNISDYIGKTYKQYGFEHEYWDNVRNFALKCWLALNRNEIFEVQITK